MRIAFHAPMKAPDDPRPSGDRTVARGLMAALRLAGHEVVLGPAFRSYDASGDAGRQARLEAIGGRLAERFLARCEGAGRPDVWFTYHLYHKAPDWIGPAVSARLGIPYVVTEASVAGKQRGGRWARGYDAGVTALGHADLVIGLNPNDRAGVLPHLKAGTPYLDQKPFLDPAPYETLDRARARAVLVARHGLDAGMPIVTVAAMMRHDQKRLSYDVLGEALARPDLPPFQLLVAGDGPARGAVEAGFAPLGPCVRFLGALDPQTMPAHLAGSDLLVWPAVKEAFGMVFLEAAFAGLPVVAGAGPGVATIVADCETGLLVPQGDRGLFAEALRRLLCDAGLRGRMGAAARTKALRGHTLAGAAQSIGGALDALRPRPMSSLLSRAS